MLALPHAALGGVLVVFPHTLNVAETPPPVTLSEAEAPAVVGANATSALVSYTITTNYYDAVRQGTFDDGFGGWYYLEDDPDGVLYGFWWSAGYVSLSGRSVPYGTGTYGWQALVAVLDFASYDIVSIQLNFTVNFQRTSYADTDANISIFIYNVNTSTVEYTVATGTIPWYFTGSTGWQSYSFTLSWTPAPGYQYLLVFYMTVPYSLYFYGLLPEYDHDLFIDNVSMLVYTNNYAVANLEALNVTDHDGVYQAILYLVSVSGTGNATITLATGTTASDPIVVVDGAVERASTTPVTLDSTDALDHAALMIVDASLPAGAELNLTMVLVYTTGAVYVAYPVNLSLRTP